MQRNIIALFSMAFFSCVFCVAGEKVVSNPGLLLNHQDVPIFYDNNPLTGLKSFTVITSFPFKDPNIHSRLNQVLEKALEAAGVVTHVQDNDMRRFGTGNVLLVQMGNVVEWNGNETSLLRLSLSVETTVTLEKTGEKIFPMIWSINTFLQGSIDLKTEGALAKAMQKLVSDFSQNYQYANPGQSIRPVFYSYN